MKLIMFAIYMLGSVVIPILSDQVLSENCSTIHMDWVLLRSFIHLVSYFVFKRRSLYSADHRSEETLKL